MTQILMTPAFATPARDTLLEKGGLYMPATESISYMKAGSTMYDDDMVIAMLPGGVLQDLALVNKGFLLSPMNKWSEGRLTRFLDILTAQPSRRIEVPRARTYGARELHLQSGVELAGLLTRTGMPAIPVEMKKADLERLLSDGYNPTTIISSREFPHYENAGTREMYRQHVNRITPPTAACAALRYESDDELGDLIKTMIEVSPLLAAEQAGAVRYKELAEELSIAPLENTLKLRQDNAREAKFHLAVIKEILPYLQALHADGHRQLPAAREVHIPTMIDSEDPVADTANWIEETWVETLRRSQLIPAAPGGPRKAA